MKIAVLANDNNESYVKPLAEGLCKMLDELNVRVSLFTNGHSWLNRKEQFKIKEKKIPRILLEKYRHFVAENNFNYFLKSLSQFDVIIIVGHLPTAFIGSNFINIELLRKHTVVPIVLYDLIYLGSKPGWYNHLLYGDVRHRIVAGENFGLERYDWYLSASPICEDPIEIDLHPVSHIGLDIRKPNLVLQDKQTTFTALIDFEQPTTLHERAIQILALEETNTPYRVLNGKYSQNEIRQEYTNTSVFFLSFRESFGLPIVENQLVGNKILLPYKEWAPAHYLKNYNESGPGELSENFIIYNNNKDLLKQKILELKNNCFKYDNYEIFRKTNTILYNGDSNALKKFINKIEKREITSKSHLIHANLNKILVAKFK